MPAMQNYTKHTGIFQHSPAGSAFPAGVSGAYGKK